MRILRFDLLAFGNFTDTSLDLSAPGVHLIYGPNEAGKSTTLRALVAFFYGIPVQTKDGYSHDMQKLRVGARLRDARGIEHELVRHKRNKNDLVDEAGRTVPEEHMLRLLGGVGQQQLEAMFALDHTRLRAGGRSLLAGGGEGGPGRSSLGSSLFGASLGSGVAQVLQSLRAEADALFRPRAHKRPIPEAIKAYEEARQRSRELALKPQAWKECSGALERCRREEEQLAQQLREREKDRAQQLRFLEVMPLLAELDRLQHDRRALGPVTLLPPGAAEERVTAEHELEEVAAKQGRLERELAALVEAREALAVPEELAQHITELEKLAGVLAAARSLQADLPRREAEHAAMVAEARASLRRLGRTAAVLPEELVVERAHEVEVSNLALEFPALEERDGNCRRAAGELERRLARRREALAQLPVEGRWRAVAATLRALEQHGDLAARRDAAILRRDQLGAQAARGLAALALRPAAVTADAEGLAQLAQLALPFAETMDRFSALWQDAQQDRTRLDGELATATHELARLEERSAELEAGGELPTEEQLATERAARDAAWLEIRARWHQPPGLPPATATPQTAGSPARRRTPRGGAPAAPAKASRRPTPVATEPAPPPSPDREALARRLEEHTRRADQQVDALRREADRAAKLADLRAALRRLEQRVAQLTEQRRLHDDLENGLGAEWAAQWVAAGVAPLPPREMLAWLSRVRDLLRLGEELGTLAAEARALEATMARHAGDLAVALERSTAGATAASLAELVREAEAVVQRGRELSEERRALETGIAEQEIESESLRAAAAAAEAQLAAWRPRWRAAVDALGFDPDLGVAEAAAALDELRTAAGKLAAAGKLRDENAAGHAELTKLRSRLQAIVTSCAGVLSPSPAGERTVEELATELEARFRQAERDRVIAEERAKRVADKQAELAQLEERRRRADGRLRKLMEQAGAGIMAVAQLVKIEQDSQAARQLDARIEVLSERTLERGGGASLAQLRIETRYLDVDGLPTRISLLGEQIDDVRRRREQLLKEIGGRENDLRSMDGSAAAAVAAAIAQEELARVRTLADRYVRCHLAAVLLEREIERYRSENQEPVLARAGVLFARLTRGAYVGLRQEYDQRGEPILLCQLAAGPRSDGATLVPVDALSDGAADQLYLALRLASLERQLAGRGEQALFAAGTPPGGGAGGEPVTPSPATLPVEPLPFVLDDAFIHFDDDRASAALAVLGELALHTQVLFFTHHAHLRDLARTALPTGQLHEHDLLALRARPRQAT